VHSAVVAGHPAAVTGHPAAVAGHPAAVAGHLAAVAGHPAAVAGHLAAVAGHPEPVSEGILLFLQRVPFTCLRALSTSHSQQGALHLSLSEGTAHLSGS
jgi:hypothetical protein